uniref:Uncharacterized protein n=1 Tax=viral metagenome TaxID=1070528 RepID=A0A6M3K0X1_9ZZZZ
MLAIGATLLTEQTKVTGQVPVFKAELYPVTPNSSTALSRFNQFDWTSIYSNGGATKYKFCCTANGSTRYLVGVDDSWNFYRFTNPTPATDFTSLGASAAAIGTAPGSLFDIAANPYAPSEVIAVRITYVGIVTTGTIQIATSSDYGATFGAWTTLQFEGADTFPCTTSYTSNSVAIAYKNDGTGNCCVVFGYYYTGGARNDVCFRERNSGTWNAAGGTSGWFEAPDVAAGVFTSMSLAYEPHTSGDWIAIYEAYVAGPVYQLGFVVLGDGNDVVANTVVDGGAVSFTDSKKTIDSFQDTTNFSPNPVLPKYQPRYGEWASPMISGWWGDIRPPGGIIRDPSLEARYQFYNKTLARERGLLDHDPNDSLGYSYLHKIANFPLLLSVCDSDKVSILQMRPDYTIDDGMFSDAAQYTNVYPLALTSDSLYMYAYNGNQIFMSPLPTNWAVPTGYTTGALTESITTERILHLEENKLNAGAYQPSSLDITLNNYDGHFDTLSIAKGDEVRLYYGFDSGGASYYQHNSYFVDYAGDTRVPNRKLFTIRAVDMWQKLEDYKFPKPVSYNVYTNTHTISEILVIILSAVGITYAEISASADLKAICPRVEISAGQSAGYLAKRLLKLVPDVLVQYGLNAYIIYPQTTDVYDYSYVFPLS